MFHAGCRYFDTDKTSRQSDEAGTNVSYRSHHIVRGPNTVSTSPDSVGERVRIHEMKVGSESSGSSGGSGGSGGSRGDDKSDVDKSDDDRIMSV